MKTANKTIFIKKFPDRQIELKKYLADLALIRLIQPELSRVKAKKLIYLKCG